MDEAVRRVEEALGFLDFYEDDIFMMKMWFFLTIRLINNVKELEDRD